MARATLTPTRQKLCAHRARPFPTINEAAWSPFRRDPTRAVYVCPCDALHTHPYSMCCRAPRHGSAPVAALLSPQHVSKRKPTFHDAPSLQVMK